MPNRFLCSSNENKDFSLLVNFCDTFHTNLFIELKWELKQVGEWRPGIGVNVTDTAAFFEPGAANVTLLVITILVSRQPYTYLLLLNVIFIPV